MGVIIRQICASVFSYSTLELSAMELLLRYTQISYNQLGNIVDYYYSAVEC